MRGITSNFNKYISSNNVLKLLEELKCEKIHHTIYDVSMCSHVLKSLYYDIHYSIGVSLSALRSENYSNCVVESINNVNYKHNNESIEQCFTKIDSVKRLNNIPMIEDILKEYSIDYTLTENGLETPYFIMGIGKKGGLNLKIK